MKGAEQGRLLSVERSRGSLRAGGVEEKSKLEQCRKVKQGRSVGVKAEQRIEERGKVDCSV